MMVRPGGVLSPERAAAQVAAHARALVAEAAAANAEALGRPAPHDDFVNGIPAAPYESVRPGGSVLAVFDLAGDCLDFVDAQLKAHGPVLTGAFRASITIYADGVAVGSPANALAAAEVVFLATVPYARKIERGESPKAPHGVFEAVAALAQARYGNVAKISFGFREPVGGSNALEAWASGHSAKEPRRPKRRQQYLKDVRQPAVVVALR
ncbi:hypothetical protein [Lichenifustis flavocetrariae]|uniref:Uncharacterized protein n=1 Tax=Lichenifustis flavocetrariae TaxID=2949735 RepID=A0AA42CNW3_9HYPH|nr:hypothetical protein [Lichenifustis flavocetrariae]MCW6509812.1 hypothetical protein [Lichenifustis flavocetrariae]